MKYLFTIMACMSVMLIGCKEEDTVTDNTPPVVSVKTLSNPDKLTDGDTVCFYGREFALEYDIATSENQKLVSCVFKYDGETVALTELSGNFQIPDRTDIDIEKKLTCEVSILSGNENFSFEYKWSVSFLVEPTRSLLPRVNQDGFLELYWNRPPVFKENFDRYILYVNYNEESPLAEITDLNQTSYVVKSYSGSGATFSMKAVLSNGVTWILGEGIVMPRIVTLQYDYSQGDGILISWSNTCNATTTVTIDDATVTKTKETSVRVPYDTFGSASRKLKLSFSPYNENDPVYLWSTFDVVQDVYLGGYRFTTDIRIGGYGNEKRKIAYNPVEDVLYLNAPARSGPQTSSWVFPGPKRHSAVGSDTYLASSYKDSKLLTNHAVYGGKELDVVNTLPLPGLNYYRSTLALTNDNRLLYFDYNDTIKVYNMDGTVLLHKINIPKIIDDIDHDLTHISPDASRIYFSDKDNSRVAVLNMDNYAISKTQELAGPFSGGWCVNPVKSEQLFVSDGKSIKEYNGEDLSPVHTWNYTDMKIGNVDPKSGYLLAYNSSFAIIIDTETKDLIHARPVVGNSFYIYSHTLISEDCQALYLSPFIK